MSDPNDFISTDNGDPLSPMFLEFCDKVRKDDPSILPKPGYPFKIHNSLSEKEGIELAAGLLENTNVTYLNFDTENYTKRSAEAMAKYVRTSKRLQRICLLRNLMTDERHHEEMLCCFLPAIQESTSLKKLHMDMPLQNRLSTLSFENMLTHTNSLQSLSLRIPPRQIYVAAASSGLKKNTTLRELTLEFSRNATGVSPILTSMRDHPCLRRLCLHGHVQDLTGLETLLLSETSKITELDICKSYRGPPMMGWRRVLRALARCPRLTKLGLPCSHLDRDEAIQLGTVLRNAPSLQSLDLTGTDLGSAELAELAPALYHNKSIKALDLSGNRLSDIESAELLRGILRSNNTFTTLDLSWNRFGETPGTVECIADGLGSNSTLLKIDLSNCVLGDGDVSTLAQTLGSRNTTLQKLTLGNNHITSLGVGVLLDTSHHITDLNLENNRIGNEGASLLANSLRDNRLPSLTRLSLKHCSIGGDGFIALVSALEQNTSLLQLDLRYNRGARERVLALAESLPDIKVLQRFDLSWCPNIASVMPMLLAGFRKNTSLLRFHVAGCTPRVLPPTPEQTARCAGGWMQKMERLGYRNCFRSLIRAPKERLPPRGVWSHALSRVATLTYVIYEVLRSKPSLVSSEDREGELATGETDVSKKRKRIDVES